MTDFRLLSNRLGTARPRPFNHPGILPCRRVPLVVWVANCFKIGWNIVWIR
jgi:hypothetical protein